MQLREIEKRRTRKVRKKRETVDGREERGASSHTKM